MIRPWPGSRRLWGVSLPELLVAAGVFAILILSLARNVSPPGSLESQLAADILAEELRSLRAKAMREYMPTALVLPRTVEGYATGFYALEGYGPPRVSRSTPLGNELKSVYIVPGTWATSATFGEPESDPNLDLSTWNAPAPTDHIIAFTPTGRVVSNLPSLRGSTSLLLSTQVALSEQTVAGQSYPRVDAAYNPTTVRVDQAGLVQVISGLPDASALPSLDARVERPVQTSLPPVMGFAGAAPPVVESIEFFPKRSPSLPPDIEASVQVGDFLRLATEASDEDGGPLTIEWWAERPSGKPGLGSFSFSQKVQMEWSEGRWRSVWEWTPPGNVDPVIPEEFILKCRIEDAEGHGVESQIGSGVGKIWAMRDGIVLYDTNKNGNRVVMAVNSDGSEERQFTDDAIASALPSASPWGDCVAVVSYAQGIYIYTRDGSKNTQIFKPVAPQKDLVARIGWNPDGSMLCFTLRSYAADPNATVKEDVYVINADGSGLRFIAGEFDVTSKQSSCIAWGFVGTTYDRSDLAQQFLLYSPSHLPTNDERTRRLSLVDGSELPLGVIFSAAGAEVTSASLSVDRQKLIGVERPNYEIVEYTIDPVTGNFGTPQPTGVGGVQPVYSFSGDKVVFTQSVAGKLQIGVMDSTGANIKTLSFKDGDSQGPTWLIGGGVIE